MISEVGKATLEIAVEVAKETALNNSFDPDKRIEPSKESLDRSKEKGAFNPDKRLEIPADKDRLYTTSEERIKQASKGNGKWLGEVGNSEFRPNKMEAKEVLKSAGISGIDYKDGNPVFDKVAEAKVTIDNMTSERASNFRYADKACAEKWNIEGRNGKTDWTRSDVREWRHNNKFSWHEEIDKKTMDLVPRAVHEECKHFGGVAECKRMERLGGARDV